jgi:hypothetical protein
VQETDTSFGAQYSNGSSIRNPDLYITVDKIEYGPRIVGTAQHIGDGKAPWMIDAVANPANEGYWGTNSDFK